MILKEYRIPMPLAVEEYRVAQRYMIAKKSLEDSKKGQGGVEIVENRPYEDGPGGKGQYTKKIYHIGAHLQPWMKQLLPKTALLVYEEGWNAYPYTMTKYYIPFMDKFTLELETVYKPNDNGTGHDNVFNLKGADLKKREVEMIDMIEAYSGKPEEDPRKYVSKTGRGPLKEGWEKATSPMMCAYKLCRVEFRYWGVQSKVESFICESALRKTILSGHQQAWAWQDEWLALTMADILAMEVEVARSLGAVMAAQKREGGEGVDGTAEQATPSPEPKANKISKKASIALPAVEDSEEELPVAGLSVSAMSSTASVESEGSEDEFWDAEDREDTSTEGNGMVQAIHDSRAIGGDEASTDVRHVLLTLWAPYLLEHENEEVKLEAEFNTFQESINHALATHYAYAQDDLAVLPVYCPPLVRDDATSVFASVARFSDPSTIPVETIILSSFAGDQYEASLLQIVDAANTAYALYTTTNPDFKGKVSVLGDRVAGVALYDILTRYSDRLTFPVDHWFTLGSPVGLVLAQRSLTQSHRGSTTELRTLAPSPACQQHINIFQTADRAASRIEPLFDRRFTHVPPMHISGSIARKGEDLAVLSTIRKYDSMFPEFAASLSSEDNGSVDSLPTRPTASKKLSGLCVVNSAMSYFGDSTDKLPKKNTTPRTQPKPTRTCSGQQISFVGTSSALSTTASTASLPDSSGLDGWWGSDRIDYQISSPSGLSSLPTVALLYATQGGYLQSRDVMAFLIRQLVPEPSRHRKRRPHAGTLVVADSPTGKWNRRRNRILATGRPMHRARDILALATDKIMLKAKFAYSVPLAGEDVEIYIMTQPPQGEWLRLDTVRTNEHGKISLELPDTLKLDTGCYPVTFLACADHSRVECTLFVLQPKTEAVIFSIDGSFAASTSLSGADPKLQPRALDIARAWASKDYLLVYVSSRPNMQSGNVTSWLARHNFPQGSVHFPGALHSESPAAHKGEYLKDLISRTQITIRAAYGSTKDVSVYQALNVAPEDTYILGSGKPGKIKYLTNGYTAEHLEEVLSVPSASTGVHIAGTKDLRSRGSVRGDPELRKKEKNWKRVSKSWTGTP